MLIELEERRRLRRSFPTRTSRARTTGHSFAFTTDSPRPSGRDRRQSSPRMLPEPSSPPQGAGRRPGICRLLRPLSGRSRCGGDSHSTVSGKLGSAAISASGCPSSSRRVPRPGPARPGRGRACRPARAADMRRTRVTRQLVLPDRLERLEILSCQVRNIGTESTPARARRIRLPSPGVRVLRRGSGGAPVIVGERDLETKPETIRAGNPVARSTPPFGPARRGAGSTLGVFRGLGLRAGPAGGPLGRANGHSPALDLARQAAAAILVRNRKHRARVALGQLARARRSARTSSGSSSSRSRFETDGFARAHPLGHVAERELELVEQDGVGARLLDGGQLLARDVLDQPEQQRVAIVRRRARAREPSGSAASRAARQRRSPAISS